ncbi:MAG: efflux transporter outer membrane subunit [Vicinamibacteria bacterium]
MKEQMSRAETFTAVTVLSILSASGCTVGPDYKRPVVTPPEAFRSQAKEDAARPTFGDTQWASVFQDEALQRLIRAGLASNYDLQIAAARILQAEAQLGINRADQFPTINGQASGQKTHGPTSNGETRTVGVAQVGGTLSWELDFWGKYRRATEAARAQLLASDWGRRAVVTSLISQLANGYFVLRALDAQLDISQRTLKSREESRHLTQIRADGGAASLVDVRQAEQLVFTARGQIVDLKRRVEQQENALSYLIGRGPGPIERGQLLTDQAHAPEVPEGLPSTLLERRPDIQQAEQLLVAANAQIGVAKASYFPQINLTGAGGVASSALSSLFKTGAWAFGATVVQPIFNAGRNRSRVQLADARHQEAELVYQQKIQQSFREASDAIVGYRSQREFRESQEGLFVAAQDGRRLADVRYRGGVTSYLEVLDSDTRLFTAELGLAQARLAELTGFVELYRSLGGGWQSAEK